MKLWVDSSLIEMCWVYEGQLPVRMKHIPPPETHNVGEYQAVASALHTAICLGYNNLEVYTDSMLVVGQVTKNWKINKHHLKGYAELVKYLLELTNSTLAWCPREENLAGLELERRKT